MEIQFTDYDKKVGIVPFLNIFQKLLINKFQIKELEQKLEEKDKLITILSNKDKLTWDTSEKLLNSIKSFIRYANTYCTILINISFIYCSQQNKIEVEKISAENMKLRGIIAQLTEKYFNIQFGLSKT